MYCSVFNAALDCIFQCELLSLISSYFSSFCRIQGSTGIAIPTHSEKEKSSASSSALSTSSGALSTSRGALSTKERLKQAKAVFESLDAAGSQRRPGQQYGRVSSARLQVLPFFIFYWGRGFLIPGDRLY